MSLKLDSLWNNFLTSGIGLAEPETIRRFKVLNLFELAFVIAAPFLGLFYFYIGAFFLFYATVIAGLLGIAAILVLRMTRNPGLAGNIAVFILWVLLIIIRYKTGGMSAGGLILLSWVWNAALILLAIFVSGYMWGTIWACLVFVESGVSVFLFQTGYNFTNLIPPEIASAYSLGSYLLGLLAVLLFAFLFQKEREDVRTREEEKSEMLRDSKGYMDYVLERLPVPTFILDSSHRVVQWNRACEEMTGIASEEILGKMVWEGFSVDEEGSLADKLLDNPDLLYEKYSDSVVSMTDSGSFAVETLLPKLKGGQEAIINTVPILDQDGRVKGAIQTIQEVSRNNEGPRARAGLKDDGIKDIAYPVFKIDSKGKISDWNRACEESFGYSLSQMVGKSPLSLVSKAYRRNFRDTMVRAFKGESFRGKEWKYQNRKGEPVYTLAKIYPVRSPSGNVQECVIINTDITDLKLKMKKLGAYAVESKENFKKLSKEYKLLKSNIASFIRKKEE